MSFIASYVIYYVIYSQLYVSINRGIFQGDSLSPLLFCLAVDPLSKLLNEMEKGYSLKGRMKNPDYTVNHLLYMDDLKLYANNQITLEQQLKLVHSFSSNIGMDFGLDKCAKLVIKKGKTVHTEGIQLNESTIINDIIEGESYKYLGIEEVSTIEHAKMRSRAANNYFKTIKIILKTYLSPKNKILAINQLATPALQYSFGIVEWPQRDINKIDTEVRKLLIRGKLFYKDQSHDRLYLPRARGGMGLVEVDSSHKASVVSLAQYIQSSTDPYLRLVREHHGELPDSLSLLKLAGIFLGEEIHGTVIDKTATQLARSSRKKMVSAHQDGRVGNWRRSKRAGPFRTLIEKDIIDKEGSFEWLKRGALNYDGERIILAAQDQGLYTNGVKKLLGLTNDDRCRFCKQAQESSNHLLAGCPVLLNESRYTIRHNRVCRVLHWRLCKHFGFNVIKDSWKHEPPSILDNCNARITYDMTIPVSRHILNGALRPDIVVIDKKKNTGLIIDVSVPNDFNICKQEREKVVKYQDLKNDMKDTYELDSTEIVPVILGATGIIKNNFAKYLKRIPGNINCLELQTEVVKESVSLLKRALGCQLLTSGP